MLEINGKMYKLCLFDTNALSSFLQNPQGWVKYYFDEFGASDTVLSYSIFSLAELYYRKELFNEYIDFFSQKFPSVVLDGHESLLIKEIDEYSSDIKINPMVLTPYAIFGEGTAKNKLISVIEKSDFVKRTEYWKNSQNSFIADMINQRDDYKKDKSKFTINDIEDFVDLFILSQLLVRDMPSKLNNVPIEEIDYLKFKSLKSISLITFYKFYQDDRKAKNSDMFDIMISSLLPYVDYFISEANLCDNIYQIQKRHNFLENLKTYRIKDIQKEIKLLSKVIEKQ